MNRTSILAGIGVFAFIGIVAGSLAFTKNKQINDEIKNKVNFEPADAIETLVAREISWQPTSELVGTVLALRSIQVSNEVAGVVTRLGFESGAIIEKDAVLVTLEDSAERADLAAAESTVRVARANVAVADTRLKLAETELQRTSEAVKLKARSDIDLDRAQAELDRSKADRERLIAEIDLAQARVTQAKTILDKRTIKTPFRGRAGLRTIHEGQYLAEGAQIVMLQEVADSINIDFAIPQEYLPRVYPGVTVMATGALLGPDPVAISVEAVDATINNNTRNVRVRAIVDNKADRLRPGMFVQIRVPVEPAKPYVVVPNTAVRRASYADQVYVILPGKPEDMPGSKRAHQRFVKLGPTVGNDVVILEGLKIGEEIAASGSFKLRDGGLVMPKPIAAPTSPAPTSPASTSTAAPAASATPASK